MILLSALAVCMTATTLFAQAPRTMSYQGLVVDASKTALSGQHTLSLKLYDQPTGGAVLHTESFAVTVENGLFHVMIGSTTPIPSGLQFDQPYWVGVSIDAGAEMSPRTALSAVPYAMRAQTIPTNAAVASLNNQTGAITIQGGGSTTVSNVGGVFTISSSGGAGGSGIQGVQSNDGSLAVTNANGPTATINIADNGVKTSAINDKAVTSAKIGSAQVNGTHIAGNAITDTHIADATISSSKLRAMGATNGQVLKYNGTSWLPGDDVVGGGGGGGLTLPYAGNCAGNSIGFLETYTGTQNAMSIVINNATQGNGGLDVSTNSNGYGIGSTTTGTGSSAIIRIQNTANTAAALVSSTTGTGKAGSFTITNANSTVPALSATTDGNGPAGTFVTSATNSPNAALTAQSNSSAFFARADGTSGSAAIIRNYNAANTVDALTVSTAGTGPVATFNATNTSNASAALSVTQSGSGSGILSSRTATTGTTGAIIGQSSSTDAGAVAIKGEMTSTTQGDGSVGVLGKNNGTGGLGIGVQGTQAGSGWGVAGDATSGRGVYGSTTSGTGVYAYASSGTGLYSSSSTGKAANFVISNSVNANDVIAATSNSAGIVANLSNTNSTSAVVTLKATTNSTASGATAIYGIANNNGFAIYGQSIGGDAVTGFVSNTGTGRAGNFTISNASSSTDALVGSTSGSGDGVYGSQAVYSASASGVHGVSTATNGTGVIGEANTGSAAYGVWGKVVDGKAMVATVSGTGTGLVVNHTGSSGDCAIFQASGTNKARIDRTGKGFFNGGTQNSGADVAEAFQVDGERSSYEPGDVLVISQQTDRAVAKSATPYSTLVSGVFATKPGVLLTDRDVDTDISDLVPMGVVGVIPTKVCKDNGSIKRGDLLVTSGRIGVAMKGTNKQKMLGAIIGKALEDYNGSGIGVIQVMVNVK